MPLNNPHYRPQRSLYQTVTTRWLTLTNFAWFLAGVLVLVLILLAVNSAKVISKKYPYDLVAMTGTQLDFNLRSTRTMGTVVFLYDSECSGCAKEMDSLLNLRSAEKQNKVGLYFLSMDEDPVNTMEFLEDNNVPESMVTYYVSPETRVNIKTVLEQHGAGNIDYAFPHTLLFDNQGRLIVEYRGYVRSQEILRTLQLYKLQQRG